MLMQGARALRSRTDHRSEEIVKDLLGQAGVTVGGDEPHDIQVHDSRFFGRVLAEGSLGLGESYVDGWWDTASLDECMTRIIRARLDRRVKQSPYAMANALRARVVNMQLGKRVFEVAQRHYDVGNDLYQEMLDARLLYTCAYWKDADSLEAAQEAKLDLVCRKVGLKQGMRVLDLGCGWGGFAKYAAETFGAEVVGYTVSREQAQLARERCAGLPVEIHLDDYRQARGSFDAVVSIGLMEHVGPKNYRSYFELVDRCLQPEGVAFVHTIAGNWSRDHLDPWFDRYIFPNAVIPSIARLGAALEDQFVLEDLHNIGPHYEPTLLAWNERFERAYKARDDLRERYDERFYRMWRYYLLASAAAFRARYLQLYQLVVTRVGTPQPACRAS
jgi:cyclopropane-fatty-acyl-phospholipid synthase